MVKSCLGDFNLRWSTCCFWWVADSPPPRGLLFLPTDRINRAHKTHIFANGTWGLCWGGVGGVGWGGGVNVLSSAYSTYFYAPEISGMLATLHVATVLRALECLQRSPVVSLLRYMLLRCRELWNACHVKCCYAAEISGMLATLHVAVLLSGGTMQLSKRVCCRSCLKRCGTRERRKEIADSSFDMLSLSRMEITILSVRCTNTWI